MGTFFSRPDVKPLGLNLVELQGGGSSPSQFEGYADDGRKIYIRYRGGRLSIENEDEPDPQRRLLLEAFIALWPHGTILLEQVCDLAGLTIGGKKPSLRWEDFRKAAAQEWLLDFSGRTTYWVRNLVLSAEGERLLIQALLARIPDLHLMQAAADTPEPAHTSVGLVRRRSLAEITDASCMMGMGTKMPLEAIGRDLRLAPQEMERVFSLVAQVKLPTRERWRKQPPTEIEAELAKRWSETLGRPVRIAHGEWTQFFAQYATGDERAESLIAQVIEALDRVSTDKVEEFDAKNGNLLGATSAVPHRNWFGRDIVDRCLHDSDCWLAIYKQNYQSDQVSGLRPAP